jgi:hypothetical protein
VHVFQEENGRWPATLDDLPVRFGDRIQIDPFTGDRFGYQLNAGGPVIYSASENGLDDGGLHSPRWNDEMANDGGSDDYVFWPPQRRR